MNTYDFPKRTQETGEPRKNYDIIYAPLFYEWQRILTKHTFVFAADEFLKQYWFSIKNIWRLYLYFSLKNSIFLPIFSLRLLRLPLAFHLLSTSMNLFGLFAITTFFRPFLDCWRWQLETWFLCGAVKLFYESRHLYEAPSNASSLQVFNDLLLQAPTNKNLNTQNVPTCYFMWNVSGSRKHMLITQASEKDWTRVWVTGIIFHTKSCAVAQWRRL